MTTVERARKKTRKGFKEKEEKDTEKEIVRRRENTGQRRETDRGRRWLPQDRALWRKVGGRPGAPTKVCVLWDLVFSSAKPNLSQGPPKGTLDTGGETLQCGAS